MSAPLIILVGLVYAYIAIESWWTGNVALGIVFTGYAASNIGLWLMAR